MTTIQQFLDTSTQTLRDADVPSARLDCLILLEDELGKDRAWILAHSECSLQGSEIKNLSTKIAQRASHAPLAYIRGKAEFYGREFIISQHVLVPRPETETMIELFKDLRLPANPTICDVGTGSGCIGITVSLELPGAALELIDIDDEALHLARKNASALGAKVVLRKADLLENYDGADVILANLPYVPERYAINRAAEHEPKQAIFGGKDGLNLCRKMWSQIAHLPHQPLFVLTEALPPQHDTMTELASKAGYTLCQAQDFIQVFAKT